MCHQFPALCKFPVDATDDVEAYAKNKQSRENYAHCHYRERLLQKRHVLQILLHAGSHRQSDWPHWSDI